MRIAFDAQGRIVAGYQGFSRNASGVVLFDCAGRAAADHPAGVQ